MTPTPPQPKELSEREKESLQVSFYHQIRMGVTRKEKKRSLVPRSLRPKQESPDKPQVTANHKKKRDARKSERQNKKKNRR